MLVALVIFMIGCGQSGQRVTKHPNGQTQVDTISSGKITNTQWYDLNGQLVQGKN